MVLGLRTDIGVKSFLMISVCQYKSFIMRMFILLMMRGQSYFREKRK